MFFNFIVGCGSPCTARAGTERAILSLPSEFRDYRCVPSCSQAFFHRHMYLLHTNLIRMDLISPHPVMKFYLLLRVCNRDGSAVRDTHCSCRSTRSKFGSQHTRCAAHHTRCAAHHGPAAPTPEALTSAFGLCECVLHVDTLAHK